MSNPTRASPNGDPRKCKLCHERDRYFNATLNEWLPYCDRECARRASELYTVDPAVLCVCCLQRPRFVDYETGIVHSFCSDNCEQGYMDDHSAVPAADDVYDAMNEAVTPPGVFTETPSGSSYPVAAGRSPQTIYFYDKNQPYYFLTNFSPHPVEWKERIYPTAEHLFQAVKFIHQYPDIAEEIRMCSRASEALAKARRYQDYRRPDWLSAGLTSKL
ncbi:unnamed protein product [Peniophora sp. CBMAI 1063]|nr:unnamed protein product [Peniophora sp. CBMAI 1063]